MAPKPNQRRRRARTGQALVEFALILPIFVGLLVALIEFSQAWQGYQTITFALREAAREAAIPGSDNATVNTRFFELLEFSGVDSTAISTQFALQNVTGSYDTLRVDYEHQFFFLAPIAALLAGDGEETVPGSITMSSRVVVRNE